MPSVVHGDQTKAAQSSAPRSIPVATRVSEQDPFQPLIWLANRVAPWEIYRSDLMLMCFCQASEAKSSQRVSINAI